MRDRKEVLLGNSNLSHGVSKIHWHPGFYGGMELELKDYKSVLSFECEHELSKEPLRLDMLIIKKNSDVEIKNQIGVLFRRYNILEFKSPDDGLTIDDYVKAVGYAYIYKSLGRTVDIIPYDELTVTLCRDVYPRELMRSIKKYGGMIEKTFPGVYYVTGIVQIPTQIVVTSELDGNAHAALKIISKHVKEEDIRHFLASEFTTQGDINNANAVLQVSSTANQDLFNQIRRRDEKVCQALMEIMSDEVQAKVDVAVDAATKESQRTSVLNLMETLHLSAEEAMDALKIPESKRAKLLA